MAKNTTKGRRTLELIILAAILICLALVLLELYNNVVTAVR